MWLWFGEEPTRLSNGGLDGGIASKLDKAYEAKPVEELVNAPVAALQGVSDRDAEHLKAAFKIVTVHDLGTNKFFLRAQTIAKLAE